MYKLYKTRTEKIVWEFFLPVRLGQGGEGVSISRQSPLKNMKIECRRPLIPYYRILLSKLTLISPLPR